MVFFLPCYVTFHDFQQRGAHGESAVTILPREFPVADGFVHPGGGGAFRVAQDIGQAVRRSQSDQQMHVVCHTTDGFWNRAECARRATEKGMKPLTPIRRDERTLMFGAEDEMNVKAQMS